jgi:hypothetical protein
MNLIDNVIRRWGNDNIKAKNQWSGYVGLLPVELYNLIKENHLRYVDEGHYEMIMIYDCQDLSAPSPSIVRISYDEIKEIGRENVWQYLYDKTKECIERQKGDEIRLQRLNEEQENNTHLSIRRGQEVIYDLEERYETLQRREMERRIVAAQRELERL